MFCVSERIVVGLSSGDGERCATNPSMANVVHRSDNILEPTRASGREALEAGARIVGLERRRSRTAGVWRSNARVDVAVLGVVMLGFLWLVLNGINNAAGGAAAIALTVSGVSTLRTISRDLDDDASTELTPDELAQLVGYVVSRPDGTWSLTPRGERAKREYLASAPTPGR